MRTLSTDRDELLQIMRTAEEKELLALERKHCSWGDTVHYLEPPKFFDRAEGHYLYDREGTPYLDLQMWYSAASLGYGNPRLNQALKNQLDTAAAAGLPISASRKGAARRGHRATERVEVRARGTRALQRRRLAGD